MARVREVGKDHWQALKMAIEEKVNIAVGSDQFPFEPNDGTTATIREAEYYVEAGMTPLQGLQAATIQPARMLGMDSAIGSLTAGKFADIVAVDSNPLVKFSALRSLGFVMKQGYHRACPSIWPLREFGFIAAIRAVRIISIFQQYKSSQFHSEWRAIFLMAYAKLDRSPVHLGKQ